MYSTSPQYQFSFQLIQIIFLRRFNILYEVGKTIVYLRSPQLLVLMFFELEKKAKHNENKWKIKKANLSKLEKETGSKINGKHWKFKKGKWNNTDLSICFFLHLFCFSDLLFFLLLSCISFTFFLETSKPKSKLEAKNKQIEKAK